MNKNDFISKNFGFYGCNAWTDCPSTLSDDKKILLGLDYTGHYEDDDCSFKYMNVETGEITYDGWTTRGACPAFNSYLRLWWRDAVKQGVIPENMVTDLIDKKWYEYIESRLQGYENKGNFYYAIYEPFGLEEVNVPCVVSNRCRSYKGEGVLLRYVKEENNFGYRRSWDIKAKVLGTDGKIYTMGAQLAQVDLKAIVDMFRSKVDENMTSPSTTWSACFPMVQVNTDDAVDVKEKAKQDKEMAFFNKKMPELIEWCKSKKPEESQEFIEQWAARIYRRKYVENR